MSDSIDGLKQRLVGAFVILTLAIIFLPMIFDKPHVVGSSKIVPVPPRPDFQTVVVTKPEKPRFEVLEVDEESEKLALKPAPEKKATKPIPAQVKSETTKQAASSKPAAKKVVEAKKTTDTQPKKAVAKKSPTSVSQLAAFKNVWMVQLGTFSDTKNAYRLRDRLRNDGYQSHTKPINVNGKKAIRVFSGPFVNKLEAEKTKKKFDAKYRLKSLVLFFDA